MHSPEGSPHAAGQHESPNWQAPAGSLLSQDADGLSRVSWALYIALPAGC